MENQPLKYRALKKKKKFYVLQMHQLITYLYMCHSYSRQFRGDCLILHDFHHYLQHRRTSHHQYHLIATRVNGLCECAYKCDHYCSHNIAGHKSTCGSRDTGILLDCTLSLTPDHTSCVHYMMVVFVVPNNPLVSFQKYLEHAN